MRYYWSGLFMIGLLFSGCGATSNSTATAATQTTTKSTNYSLVEVAQHATATDCWMVIDNQVYDVTTYVGQHPGGSQILTGCGKDASGLFNGTTMMGRAHSRMAKMLLNHYWIGSLTK